MNSRREKEISRWLDGELAPAKAEAVQQRVEADTQLRDSAEAWRRIGQLLREEAPAVSQTPEAAWADVQRALRQQGGREAVTSDLPWGAKLAWAGGLMALLLVLALGLFSRHQQRYGTVAFAAAQDQPVEVEWVEVEWPGSTPMVFQDEETGLTVIWMVELDTKELSDAES